MFGWRRTIRSKPSLGERVLVFFPMLGITHLLAYNGKDKCWDAPGGGKLNLDFTWWRRPARIHRGMKWTPEMLAFYMKYDVFIIESKENIRKQLEERMSRRAI